MYLETATKVSLCGQVANISGIAYVLHRVVKYVRSLTYSSVML